MEGGFPRLWFTSTLTLREVGKKLGLTKVKEDCEDYWAWIIGYDRKSKCLIDIYKRRELKKGARTKIFIMPVKANDAVKKLKENLAVLLAERLLKEGIAPVYFGTIFNAYHHDFKAEVIKRWR